MKSTSEGIIELKDRIVSLEEQIKEIYQNAKKKLEE
jgi:hypothetical protein